MTETTALSNQANELFRLASKGLSGRVDELNLAPSFNGFRLLNPNELALSAALANLLDPKGNHAQNDLFLRKFFVRFLDNRSTGALEHVEVKLEYSIENRRRIDLVVKSENFVLAFENKPWASDQREQISDYLSHLESIKPLEATKLLIYLSQDGGDPSDLSISEAKLANAKEQKKLKVIAYLDLVKWLNDCEKDITAPNVKHFVAEFIGYINFQFDAHESAIAEKLNNPLYLDAAFDIAKKSQAKEMLSEEIEAAAKISATLARFRLAQLKKLADNICNIFTQTDWPPSFRTNFDANFYFGQRFEISIPENPQYVFAFAFANRGISHELHWGIECSDRSRPPIELKKIAADFTKALNEACVKPASPLWICGRTTWLSYQKFGVRKWDTAEPWVSMHKDDCIAREMKAKIEELHNLLKENKLLEALR